MVMKKSITVIPIRPGTSLRVYLNLCNKDRAEPFRIFSGKFNVRVPHTVNHRMGIPEDIFKSLYFLVHDSSYGNSAQPFFWIVSSL